MVDLGVFRRKLNCEDMNEEIWSECVTRWERTAKLLKAKGAKTSGPEILPPPPSEQIEEFEEDTCFELPTEFKTLMSITGGFKISWSIYGLSADQKPPVFFGTKGGNYSDYFVGASQDRSLLQHYNSFQQQMEASCVGGDDEEATRELHEECFPLYPSDFSGDYLVLRLDCDPCEIHFLDHEYGYRLDDSETSFGQSSLVSRGFTNFLMQWTALSYPEPRYLPGIVEYGTSGEIGTETKEAILWKKWLEET